MTDTKKRLERLFRPPTQSETPAFEARDLNARPREFNAPNAQPSPREHVDTHPSPALKGAVGQSDRPPITPRRAPGHTGTRSPLTTASSAKKTANTSISKAPANVAAPNTSRESAARAREAWLRAQSTPAAPNPTSPNPTSPNPMSPNPAAPNPAAPTPTVQVVPTAPRTVSTTPPMSPTPASVPSPAVQPLLRREHPLQIERDAQARARQREAQALVDARSRMQTFHARPRPAQELAEKAPRALAFEAQPQPPNLIAVDTPPASPEASPEVSIAADTEEGARADKEPKTTSPASFEADAQGVRPPDTSYRLVPAPPIAAVLSSLALSDLHPHEELALITLHWERICVDERHERLTRLLGGALHVSERLRALRLMADVCRETTRTAEEIAHLKALAELSHQDPWPRLRLVQIYREVTPDAVNALHWAEDALRSAPWHGPTQALVHTLKRRKSFLL